MPREALKPSQVPEVTTVSWGLRAWDFKSYAS